MPMWLAVSFGVLVWAGLAYVAVASAVGARGLSMRAVRDALDLHYPQRARSAQRRAQARAVKDEARKVRATRFLAAVSADPNEAAAEFGSWG